MSKHVPAPWAAVPAHKFGLSKNHDSETDDKVLVSARLHDGDAAIALVYRDSDQDDANCVRIMDCVNACEGIEDPSVITDLISVCVEAREFLVDNERRLKDYDVDRVLTMLNAVLERAEGYE